MRKRCAAPAMFALMFILIFACTAHAQEKNPPDPIAGKVVLKHGKETVTLTDPAPVKLADLFKQADVVGLIHILSGDEERYSTVVYKAEVIRAFKGVEKGQSLFLGPFVGLGIGEEYLAFLSRSDIPKQRQTTRVVGISYGDPTSYYRVMYEGYSIMDIEYTCIFHGKEIREQCDYGVKLTPQQVLLPTTIKAFPEGEPLTMANYHKWVRKDDLLSYLENLRTKK